MAAFGARDGPPVHDVLDPEEPYPERLAEALLRGIDAIELGVLANAFAQSLLTSPSATSEVGSPVVAGTRSFAPLRRWPSSKRKESLLLLKDATRRSSWPYY